MRKWCECSVFHELFNAVLFSSLGVQWALSRPLLSVYLTYETSLSDYFTYLQNQCAPEKHDKLNNVYTEIAQLPDRSLDAMSRDSFSMNLTKWRRQLLEVVYQRSFSVCLPMIRASTLMAPFHRPYRSQHSLLVLDLS